MKFNRITIVLVLALAVSSVAFGGRVEWRTYNVGRLNGATAETINLSGFLRGSLRFHVVAEVDTFKADVTVVVPTLQVLKVPGVTARHADTMSLWQSLAFTQSPFGGKDSWYFTGATNTLIGRVAIDSLAAGAVWADYHSQHYLARFIFKNRAAADTTKAAKVTFYALKR